MANVKKLNGYDIKDAKALRNKSTADTNSFIDERAGTSSYPTIQSYPESNIIGYGACAESNTNLTAVTVYGYGAKIAGSWSVAVGRGAVAAQNSVAYGYNASATVRYSTAIGSNATVTSEYSVAVGESAKGQGLHSAAMGDNARANTGSVSIGGYSVANGQYDIAIGRNASVNSSTISYAIAVGYSSYAQGNYAIAIGASAGVNNNSTDSIAIGNSSRVNMYCLHSVAIGKQATVAQSESVQLGTGTNTNYGSLQFRNWQVIDQNGKIPEDRLPNGVRTATPHVPNLYDIAEENVSETAILYTGATNDSYTNSQFYRGCVRYGYPHFSCGWVDSDWLDSQNDVMIDQQKLFIKLAEVTKERIDDDDIENGLIGGGNAEQTIYLIYDADNDYYLLRFDSDSFEAAFNHTPDDVTGLSFDDLADYGIYFRNFHKPSDLEGEYEFCDIYYYAPVYIDGCDWNDSPSYINYLQFLDAMKDGDWGVGYVIPNRDEWSFEIDGNTYWVPIIPKTYEYDDSEYDGIEFRWEWDGTGDGSWKQYINSEYTGYDWSTQEMYDTFGIYIQPGQEENVEYINLYVRGGDQRYWEQFDPVDIENFATSEQFEGLSDEVDALKNWSVQVVTGGKDLNDYTTEGIYQFVGAPITNKPSTVDTRFIMMVQVLPTLIKQIIFATKVSSVVGTSGLTSYAPTIFHRVRNSGTWVAWQTVLSGDWANYITGFDRTKQQKLVHYDNSHGDGTSASPVWVQDTAGGNIDCGTMS